MSGDYVKVAQASDFADNEGKAFAVDGHNVLVCKTRDGFFAIENRCTHQMAELAGGKIRGAIIACPLHGQRFNLKDGKPIGPLTDKPVPTFPVKVEGDDILILAVPNGGAPD